VKQNPSAISQRHENRPSERSERVNGEMLQVKENFAGQKQLNPIFVSLRTELRCAPWAYTVAVSREGVTSVAV